MLELTPSRSRLGWPEVGACPQQGWLGQTRGCGGRLSGIKPRVGRAGREQCAAQWRLLCESRRQFCAHSVV